MQKSQFHDPLDRLLGGGLGMAFGNGLQVFDTLQAVGLETAFVFVKAGAIHAAALAGFAHIAQRLGELEDGEALVGDFLGWIFDSTLAFVRQGTGISSRHGRCRSLRHRRGCSHQRSLCR